jgi:hypothetical protein
VNIFLRRVYAVWVGTNDTKRKSLFWPSNQLIFKMYVLEPKLLGSKLPLQLTAWPVTFSGSVDMAGLLHSCTPLKKKGKEYK